MTQVGPVEAPRGGATVEPAPYAPEAVAKPPPFPEQERQGFRAEDAGAGGMIVTILLGIFSIGLLIYLWILLVALS
jgi:hypothetical protein